LESLVPIVGLIGNENQTKVVLAGDARQLGPIDTNEYFRKSGISESKNNLNIFNIFLFQLNR